MSRSLHTRPLGAIFAVFFGRMMSGKIPFMFHSRGDCQLSVGRQQPSCTSLALVSTLDIPSGACSFYYDRFDGCSWFSCGRMRVRQC